MNDTGFSTEVIASVKHWRDGRRYLNEHRHELSQWAARNLYADHLQVGQSGLLTRPEWMPTKPIPLEKVTLKWCGDAPSAEVDGTEPESAGVRPLKHDGGRYPTYAEALGDLARPRLYEDRPCYRLLDVELQDGRAQLSFGLGAYFDVMNVSEAAAHELANASRTTADGSPTVSELPFRSLIGDPCDLARRPILPAISVLTIRRTATDASFILHWRDSAKVAHGGGLCQVMPVGMFQPSDSGPRNLTNDFDLWRCMIREYSEEFLGAPEHRGHDNPLNYSDWPFFRSLTSGRDDGKITAHLVGLGVDPLSLVTDILVTVVFDDHTFDAVFANMLHTNAEGRVFGTPDGMGGAVGVPLTNDRLTSLIASEHFQAAGAALLIFASKRRASFLES